MTASPASSTGAPMMNGCCSTDISDSSAGSEESSSSSVYASVPSQQIQLQQDRDWLKCPVCAQTFSDPWLLRCLHTVCSACFDAKVEHDGRNECPVCLERDVFGHMKVRPDFAVRRCTEELVAPVKADLNGGTDPMPSSVVLKSLAVCVGVGLLDSHSSGDGSLSCSRPAVMYCVTCSPGGRYLCSSCLVVHLEMNPSHRVQSAGDVRVSLALRNNHSVSSSMSTKSNTNGHSLDGEMSLTVKSSSDSLSSIKCWLHADQRLNDYCITCQLPMCCVCVETHPSDHRCAPIDFNTMADELSVFCAHIDAQKRKTVDMKKILVRQLRRQNDAFERCRRLIEDHHELLLDVLPLEKPRLLGQLAESYRLHKTLLEKFGERALVLAESVGHVIAVVERHMQLTTAVEILALKKPAESRIGAINRRIDEHFSVDQPISLTMMKTSGELARDMLRLLYRGGFGMVMTTNISSVPPHPHHQLVANTGQQIVSSLGAECGGESPPIQQLGTTATTSGVDMMGALNGFGSSTSASGSSHGSSPELSLETSASRGSSVAFESQNHSINHAEHHHHHKRQQSMQHHPTEHAEAEQEQQMALMSDLTALLNENNSGDGFALPFELSSNNATAVRAQQNMNSLSHRSGSNGVSYGTMDMTTMQMELHSVEASSSMAASGGGTMTSPITTNGAFENGNVNGTAGPHVNFGQSILSGVGMERTFNTSFDSGFSGRFSPYSAVSQQYGRWSNGADPVEVGGGGSVVTPAQQQQMMGVRSGDSSTGSLTPVTASSVFPPRGQVRRQKMIYNVKLGEFGVMEGQFTEPSGVAVNARNEIIVADTNNHRIQVFDKEGRFQFSFGECGKREGQLLYPNRVFVNKQSGDIVVTERSPTHQIQIYNQYGAFVRKFGADILQHPRGVTVDCKNRIIVVECKVMRVLIFDYTGEVIKRFGCSRHLEFPNGVAVNEREEIFISDNRAHCVKVFNYDGVFLRKIGGEGITNYPIGVGINQLGQVVVADNHNNFNLTVFAQDGQIISALESKVKHAQCFDMALMEGGSVVLASKDYRLYVYRYAPVPIQQQQVHHHHHHHQQQQQQLAPASAVAYPTFAY